MSLRQTEVVIDCADHDTVVGFWTAALGWERRDVNEQYVAVVPSAADRGADRGADGGADSPRPLPILFQKVPEPKTVKNRVHIDFQADDMAAEVARLVGLGASVLAERSLGDFRWTVLADPEGTELCVAQG
jgi:predicted enzyme related to lactoylglutathione lyase